MLLPLSLINEIDRTGKTSIDETVREKRLNMKLIIATSLGQGWLINHPECKVDNSTHAVFSQLAQPMSNCTIKALKPFINGCNQHPTQRLRLEHSMVVTT